MMNKDKDLIKISRNFLDMGFLVNSEVVRHLPENFNFKKFINLIDMRFKKRPFVINEDILDFVLNGVKIMSPLEMNWLGFDEARIIKEKTNDKKTYGAFLDILNYSSNPSNEKASKLLRSIGKEYVGSKNIDEVVNTNEDDGGNEGSLIVLNAYKENIKEREVQDFVNYFRTRYDYLKDFLYNRQNLQGVVSINRVLNKFEKENVSVIGMINNKRVTKNGNIILELEDLTGTINLLINKSREKLFKIANNLLLDEVIGATGVCSRGFGRGSIIFCDELILPSVPVDHEFKKLDKEVYAVFTGDIQLGNKYFCAKDFLKFIDWINGDSGNKEQREIAKKVRYLFFVGDLVDGVGVYPNHDKDLEIKDVYEQYSLLAKMLSKIRKNVKIVLIGGNHDAIRIAEPQPLLDRKIAAPLYEMPNVVMLNNPGFVNICSSANFSGFDILLYHGYSFPYISEHINEIRINGGIKRPDLIMKAVLERRHLAPTHGSTLYIPDYTNDTLIIKKIPDFFATGHIHKTVAVNYKNITLMGCGCWIRQTENQKKRGIEPDPSRVILVNLQNREMKMLYFGD